MPHFKKEIVRWTLASLCIFAVLQAHRAEAQDALPGPRLGDAGHLAISGERLFGYTHSAETQTGTAGTGDTTLTSNTVSILGNPATAIANAFTFPRVGFDYFAGQGFSFGASLTYFRLSQKVGAGAPQVFGDNTFSGYALAPRLGFAARVSPAVAIWPRAGISYLSVSNDSTSSASGGAGNTFTSSTSFFDLTLEAPVAVDILPRVVLLIGPTFDLGLSGTAKSGGGAPSNDIKITEFGVQVGFLFLI